LTTPVESVISKAYVPEGRFSGVQVKEPPVPLEVMVWTSWRSSLAPPFSLIVTGSTASVQVIVKGTPSVTPKSVLVILTALVSTARALMRRTEYFMLAVGSEWAKILSERVW